MELFLASSNKDKIKEIKEELNGLVDIELPKKYGIEDFEVEEDSETLKGNAFKKANELFKLLKKPTLADDTGLFVNSLNGRPGVHSHRYASENPSYKQNRKKLLKELKDKQDRSAYFMTVICYIDENGIDHYFEGKILGHITEKEFGDYDFGYDQIFKPNGCDFAFGQMTFEEKNKFSHRGLALEKFKRFLKEN